MVRAEDLVLAAVVRHPRDLDIARVLGWYRIPVGTAPTTLRVDWLAFYQTGAFGEERWSVRQVAAVRGFELVRRGELLRDEPDHPRAGEPYFKIALGPVEPLPRPIRSKRWKRFTFVCTTGDRLLAARDVTELTVSSAAERDRLWRMLSERPM